MAFTTSRRVVLAMFLFYSTLMTSATVEPSTTRSRRAVTYPDEGQFPVVDDFWRKYGDIIIQELSKDYEPAADMDVIPPLSKRFGINSHRLFRPFYHPRYSQPNSIYAGRHLYGKRNYNALIAKLLALRGYKPPRRLSFVRFGPGRR